LATSIEQLVCLAYPALPKNNIRRDADKALTDEVEDPLIKIQNEHQDMLGELISPIQAKRPKTIGMLKLWGPGLFWGGRQ
jgi:hypothetical protein